MSKQDKSRLFSSYRLVKKLNLGEKLVGLNSKEKNDNKGYLLLFKVLKSINSFDRQLVFEKMKSQGYSKNQVINFGNYLFYIILETASQKNHTPNSLFELFAFVEILKSIEEYSEALSLVQTGKEKSKASEQFEVYAQFTKEELSILSQSKFRESKLPEIKARIEELKVINSQMSEMVSLLDLYYQGAQLLEQKWSLKPRDQKGSRREILLALERSEMLKKEYSPSSISANFLQLSTKLVLFRSVRNDIKAMEISQKVVALFEGNEAILTAQKGVYLNSLYQMGLLSIRLKDFVSYFQAFEKIQKLKDISNSSNLDKLFFSSLLEITFRLEASKTHTSQLPEIELSLKKFPIESFSTYRVYLLSISACLYFLQKRNCAEALRWINTAINLPSKAIPPQREIAVRALQIVCLIEKGQPEVALARISAFRKFKNRRKLTIEHWNEVISLWIALCQNYEKAQEMTIWSEFLQKFDQPIKFLMPFDLLEYGNTKMGR